MMSRKSTIRTTLSAAVIATMLAGCASTSNRVVSHGFGGRSNGDLGLATRALAALASNNIPEAIALAERAVEKTPADAGFRTLLGNAYFAAGRFRSAEQAYKDALSIYANQPQALLRLALVQIAQGKGAEAMRFLEAGRDVLDPADVGLAMALAGRAQDAVALLDQAARSNNADARVRQNLALAYALSGDWQQARIIAAQDVPAAELDARLQQWMAMANPVQPSDQVAALIGVAPALADPGQPVRLALVKEDTRLAEAVPVAEPAPVPVAVAEPQPVEQQVAAVEAQLAPVQPAPEPEPAFAAAVVPPPPPNPLRVAASSPAEVPMALAETARQMLPKIRAAASESRPKVRRASAPAFGKSGAVVQLGAYRSPSRVLVAWDAAAKRFHGLSDYAPLSARFEGPNGTVYRLSVKGFANRAEASAMCAGLRQSGGSCFVRNSAGDRPIQLASR
ncbi:MAG: tetratricopeptide repeat protein [Sphingomicrobium sp.]